MNILEMAMAAKMAGGGVSSWNDLTDKPFYEKTTTVQGDTLTWDGNTEGLEVMEDANLGTMILVSGAAPTLADCANGATLTTGDGSSYTMTLAEMEQMHEMYGANGLFPVAEGWLVVPNDNFALDMGGIIITFPKAGIWWNTENREVFPVSLTIPGYTGFVTTETVVQTIDPKFLPKALQFGETVVYGDTLTWDGNTEGLAAVWIEEGVGLCKVSDAVPTKEDCANGLSITFAGETMTFPAEDVQASFADDGFMFAEHIAFVPTDNYYWASAEVTFPEAGVYFASAEGMVTTELVIPGYTGFAKKEIQEIDPKFLPKVSDLSADWIAELKTALGIG